MRINRAAALILFLVLFLASGLMLPPIVDAEPPREVKLDNVLRQPLNNDFTAGREIIVTYVELPPNITMERHWHPGEEFHYYIEGEVEIAIDNAPSIIGRPGTVGHVPFKVMHTAITRDKGAKFVVFRVHTLGEPVRYLEEGGSSER